jgi:hypothetical protein
MWDMATMARAVNHAGFRTTLPSRSIRRTERVVTTQSNHGRKIYSHRLTGTDQLWVADLTESREPDGRGARLSPDGGLAKEGHCDQIWSPTCTSKRLRSWLRSIGLYRYGLRVR